MAVALVDWHTDPEVFGKKMVPQSPGLLSGGLLVFAFLKLEEYFHTPDPLFAYCCDIMLGVKMCNANASRQGCRLPMLAE